MAQQNLALDLALGTLAGAAAVWALDRVDWFLYNREPEALREKTRAVRGGTDPAHTLIDRAATALGREPPGQPDYPNPTALGNAVHYGMGVSAALPYAALRRRFPWLSAGYGSAFGAALFLLQDEGLNTVIGLAAKPQDYHWRTHARGLVAHVAFGVVLETLLRAADAFASGMRRTDAAITAASAVDEEYGEMLAHPYPGQRGGETDRDVGIERRL
ncbi:MAG TPA: hypothetical protein VEA80_06925 [Vitreimonas sp.]|uniref:hypothetical protein n=1 Tax=Vitreimonas sp. TaxID=3069702 RepID=UPI002D44EE6E|nr:hypothetical protein [Vitreimonas sp.]HYD87188.1 hypothetical protein [Vitreimonas sp.]